MKITYEPHPVAPERKAELRAQGFRIIDARFAPDDATSEEKPRTRRKTASVEDQGSP